MRRVLLELSLAEPLAGWDGLTLGVGWLLLLVAAIWATLRYRDARPWTADEWISIGTFAAIAGAVVLFGPSRGLTRIPLFGYGFFVLLGFLCGTALAQRRLRAVGWPPDLAFRVGFWILLAGVVGARAFFLAQHGGDGFAGKSVVQGLGYIVNLPDGGLVLYGGVIAGTLAYLAFCFAMRLPPLRLADILTPSVLVGIAFGRLGCLMNGCCYGDVCTLPWAITFPELSPAYVMMINRGFLLPGETVPLHPTQVYSTISATLLAVATSLYFWRRNGDGSVVALGLVGYALHRFLVEFLRGDELGQLGTGLTISQLISLGIAALGVALAVFVGTRNRPDGEFRG